MFRGDRFHRQYNGTPELFNRNYTGTTTVDTTPGDDDGVFLTIETDVERGPQKNTEDITPLEVVTHGFARAVIGLDYPITFCCCCCGFGPVTAHLVVMLTVRPTLVGNFWRNYQLLLVANTYRLVPLSLSSNRSTSPRLFFRSAWPATSSSSSLGIEVEDPYRRDRGGFNVGLFHRKMPMYPLLEIFLKPRS